MTPECLGRPFDCSCRSTALLCTAVSLHVVDSTMRAPTLVTILASAAMLSSSNWYGAWDHLSSAQALIAVGDTLLNPAGVTPGALLASRPVKHLNTPLNSGHGLKPTSTHSSMLLASACGRICLTPLVDICVPASFGQNISLPPSHHHHRGLDNGAKPLFSISKADTPKVFVYYFLVPKNKSDLGNLGR